MATQNEAGETAQHFDVAVVDQFADKNWRLANLYYIENKAGEKVRFVPNEAQAHFFQHMWYLNVNLKARQLGFTTAWCIYILDECLFYPNQTAGVIAHTLDDAKKIFRNKIEYPYRNLPADLQAAIPAANDTAQELVFTHNSEDGSLSRSSISVGTSMRSGTLQYLLVSEFGKICAKYPEKAEEIVTGSLNTVASGNYITIESTAEGTDGHFFDTCKKAQDLSLLVGAGTKKLTQLDFKFHFYGWYWDPEYVLSAEDTRQVVIDEKAAKYFVELEINHGIYLTPQQKAWYVKKKESQGDLMLREYPSTWKEAFQKSITGAYFSEQFLKARKEGRITRVPHQDGIGVDTWWDLGIADHTSIWFTQDIGREIRVIDYYENTDVGLKHYIEYLHRMRDERGYIFRHHVAPHDIEVRELTTGVSRLATAKKMGIRFQVGAQTLIEDQIQEARDVFSLCWFDEERTAEGLKGLENYRKEWSERLGKYLDKPLHNWASHPTSAFMLMATMRQRVIGGSGQRRQVERVSSRGWT